MDNPYAPPGTEVADLAPVQATAQPWYHATSALKLLLLTLATGGIYQYVWFYKNWKLHRLRSGEEVSPAARTFFAVFYCYPLLQRIRSAGAGSPGATFPAGPLATLWIISSLLWKLPDPYWLVIFLAPLALLPVQRAINTINQQQVAGHDPNTRITAWNWVVLVMGLPIFALAVYGTFVGAA